ncbi:MAG: thiol reductant ABC exporter subunit CydD, partial [Chloroflexi bacterium]|nr:thiol reductant ABC exporter subunit CydD [Chloroflexota bacterium]
MNLDKRLLQQLARVRGSLSLAVIAGLIGGLLLVAQAYMLSQIISRVFLDGQTLAEVTPLLIGLVINALARAGLLWIGEIGAHEVAGRIKLDLRERLFAHLIALGPAYTRGERTGELANTAVNGIEELDAYFSQYIPQLALSALLPLAMLVVIFPLDMLSGIVLLLTAPVIPFMMILIGSAANAQSRKQWAQLSRMSAHFLDVLQGLTTLKIFGRSREQIEVIGQISRRFGDTTMSVLRIAFLSALALEMLATISTAIIAVEIGVRLLASRIAFDQALFVLILAPEYYLPLRMLGTRFHAGVSGVAAAQRIFEVLETETALIPGFTPIPPTPFPRSAEKGGEVTELALPKTGNPWVAPTESGRLLDSFIKAHTVIRFESVGYAYDGGERPALNGVSFEMAAGQKIALVGRSGAGKSTVVQLLLRFIEPDSGQISADGLLLSHIPAAVWREQIAWVPQMPYLFAGSVADNIRLAQPDAPMEDVIRAAQLAHADEFIQSFPA